MNKVSEVPRLFSTFLSDQSRTEKAHLNSVASALDYGSRIAVAFLVTPWLVAGLGDYFYGTWQILNRLVGYISPTSGRPTSALKWVLASHQASTDYEQKRRYVGSAVAVWALFLPLMALLGGVVAWYAPLWLNSPAEYVWQVRLATGLLVANLAMTSLAALPRSVLIGENLGYKRMGLSTILVFTGGGLTWLALYFDTGIVGVAAAALASTLLSGVLYLHITRTCAPWFGVARPSLKAARQFLGLSGWFLVWNLIVNLMLASDVVILGLLDSVEAVPAYTLTRYAPETMLSIVVIIVSGVLPGLGGIIGAGNLQKAAKVRGEVMSFTWLVVAALGSTILLWNRVFVELWVGAEYYAGSIPHLLIVLVAMQFILIRNDAAIIDLTLRLRRKVQMGAASVVIALGAAGVMVGHFGLGIVGLCLGLILGRSILSVGYPVLVGRHLGVTLSSQLKSMPRPALVTGLLFSVALLLSAFAADSTWAGITGWIGFVLSAGVTAGAALLLAFYMGLSGDQRRNVVDRVRMVVPTITVTGKNSEE
jgi:O-antigen/teichoic acid export membrane protein